MPAVLCETHGHLLRFGSLFHPGRGLSFPCDAQGHVDLDRLCERERANYLYARAVAGASSRHPRWCRPIPPDGE